MTAQVPLPSAEFLSRYDIAAPRYTSYPTAPVWNDSVNPRTWRTHLESSAHSATPPASLYCHIPFCEHRCAFCACNVIISRKPAIAEPYIDRLIHELELTAATAARQRSLVQIHWGGGTPNYLDNEQAARLMQAIRATHQVEPDAEISIELDPRHLPDDKLNALIDLGFNRISLGVQDFDPQVQKAIDRIQPVEETRRVTQTARSRNIAGVNFDLIYGLPYQTPASFANTLNTVLDLSPDRIALYNFAYLPSRLKHQQGVDVASMPRGTDKFELFRMAVTTLTGAGYVYIGMDHFAKPSDELATAWRDRTIQRNFMGYTTRAGHDLFAFGTSSIGFVQGVYAQNSKHLATYFRMVDAGEAPVERGMILSNDDRLRAAVISDLMCFGRVDKRRIESAFDVKFDRVFAKALAALAPLQQDNLVSLGVDQIEVTPLGQALMRNVAMHFDAYLEQPDQTRVQYSKAV